ncbi:hypothetical protein M426DRAFT_95107 [Hypoxylon sp. CI-4A]|nr:hypothetical protein M426DRAFT_95107 [Hypoxylon sp. CI-4A]
MSTMIILWTFFKVPSDKLSSVLLQYSALLGTYLLTIRGSGNQLIQSDPGRFSIFYIHINIYIYIYIFHTRAQLIFYVVGAWLVLPPHKDALRPTLVSRGSQRPTRPYSTVFRDGSFHTIWNEVQTERLSRLGLHFS